MPIITPKAPRWYDQQGNPLYEVPCKGKPGTMREFTLADARKMDPKPLVSVTTVIKDVLKKEGLEIYKLEQAIKSSLTLPRAKEPVDQYRSRAMATQAQDFSGFVNWCYENPPRFLDSEDEFAAKVAADMEQEAEDAAAFGKEIHRAIEAHLTGDMPTLQALPESVMPWLDEFCKWQESVLLTVNATELVVVSKEAGYAGRMDAHGQLNWEGAGESVLDFKTQRIKNGKPAFYPDWALQLAAYAYTFDGPQKPSLVSVVIDSTKPSPPIVKVWEEPRKHYNAFLNVLALWKYLKNHP